MPRTKVPKTGTAIPISTKAPSTSPRPTVTLLPSSSPSISSWPSNRPSQVPSVVPSVFPSVSSSHPSLSPSSTPSLTPSSHPSQEPSSSPSESNVPTVAVTVTHTNKPIGIITKTTPVVFTYIMGLSSSKDLAGTSYTSKTLTVKGTHWYIVHYITLSIRDTLQESTAIPNSIQIQDPLNIQNQEIISDSCPDEFLQQSQACFRIVASIQLDILSSNTLSETQISTLVTNEMANAMGDDGTFLTFYQSYQNDSSLQFKYIGEGSIVVKPKDYNEKLVVRASVIAAVALVFVALVFFKCRNICRKNDDTIMETKDGFFASLTKKFQKGGGGGGGDYPSNDENNIMTPNTTFSKEVSSPTSMDSDRPYTADWHNHPVESSTLNNEWQHHRYSKHAAQADYNFDWQDNPSLRPQQRQRSPSTGNPLPYHERTTSGDGSLESNLSIEQETFQVHPSTPDVSVGTNSTGSFSLDKYFKKRENPEDEQSDDGGDVGWWS